MCSEVDLGDLKFYALALGSSYQTTPKSKRVLYYGFTMKALLPRTAGFVRVVWRPENVSPYIIILSVWSFEIRDFIQRN